MGSSGSRSSELTTPLGPAIVVAWISFFTPELDGGPGGGWGAGEEGVEIPT
jgi:hypothetical protein